MSGVVHREIVGDYEIEIHIDEDAENPRLEMKNLGLMVCFHNRKDLGDKGHGYSCRDYTGWGGLKKDILQDHGKDCIILPVYMYEHSSIALQCSPFNDYWDSGQIGFIFCPAVKARRWFNKQRLSKKYRKFVSEGLANEVKLYSQYVNGEVYGYIIKKDDEEVASCWGYLGDGDEYALSQAKEHIGYLEDRDKGKKCIAHLEGISKKGKKQ
jgi:hypothetical protein